MLTKAQAKEIMQTLQALPADKLAEVFDYLTFLRERYGEHTPVDMSEAWSEEDVSDLIRASLSYAEQEF
ncbi:MAG: hypothetical protein KGJ80_05555 [Chloroflexota bacterium]|nr:hypothetical protein [Chloroflexota bacterium]